MNDVDQQLRRLLRVASRAPKCAPDGVPLSVQTGVLAAWKAHLRERVEASFYPMLKLALGCACLIMFLTTAWSLLSLATMDAEILSIANSSLQLSLAP